jgi:hypothetical protein
MAPSATRTRVPRTERREVTREGYVVASVAADSIPGDGRASRQALAAILLRQTSIPVAPTAIATIAMTPPIRLLVDVRIGFADGATATVVVESLDDGVPYGVIESELAGAVGDSGGIEPGTACVVVCPAVVVAALVAATVFFVVAAAVVAGAWVVAVCLGGETPGATYPPPTGAYRQPSASPAVGWNELGPTLE